MATLKSNDNKEMIIMSDCGCDEGIRVKIEEAFGESFGEYCYQTYISGNWYKEQVGLLDKLKKIWAIIRNKDFYYSDIVMSKEDFQEYKKWINSVEVEV